MSLARFREIHLECYQIAKDLESISREYAELNANLNQNVARSKALRERQATLHGELQKLMANEPPTERAGQ